MSSKRKSSVYLSLICSVLLLLSGGGCNREQSEVNGQADSKLVTVAIGEAPTTTDPVAALDVGSTHLLNSMHAPLCVVGPDGKLVMVLAESVTMAADGMSCDIKLKPSKFWDDHLSPVTALDVRYSFERVRSSAHPHRWIIDRVVGVEAFDKKEAEHLAGIVIRNERELTVRLAKPDPDFALLISSGLTSIIKEGTDKSPKLPFDRHIVGAGPWKPARFNPGSTFEMTANPGFPERGNAERLRFVVEANGQNQLEGAAKGKYDFIRLRGPMLAESCERVEGTGLQPKPEFKSQRIVQARANELVFLKWNWSNAQLRDIPESHRRSFLAAVSSRIPRAAMARRLYLDAGEPAYGIAPPSTLPSSTQQSLPNSDTNGIGERKLTLLAANDPSSRQLAGYLQTELREVGLNIELSFVDLGGLVQRLLNGEFAVAVLWVEQQIPSTGCFAYTMFFTPGAPFTLFGQPIDGLGESALAARGVLDMQARRMAYASVAGEIGRTQTAWTPLLSRSTVMMVNSRCDGLFLDSNGFPYYLFLRLNE